MGEVINFPLRKKRRTKRFGVFVLMLAPWDAGDEKEAMEGVQRVMDNQLGHIMEDGRFVIQVGDMADMEKDFEGMR